MKSNVGTADRIIRFIVGVVALVVSFLVGSLAWQIVLWVVAAVAFISSALAFSLPYVPFHFSTKRK